jgi:hypothetical protein
LRSRIVTCRSRSRISPTEIRHDTSTVELVENGRVRNSFLVYEGHRSESIDDEASRLDAEKPCGIFPIFFH